MSSVFDADEHRDATATRIRKMKWNEISGVDRPANNSPGWLLQKSADAPALNAEAITKAVTDKLAAEVAPLMQILDRLNSRLDKAENGRS